MWFVMQSFPSFVAKKWCKVLQKVNQHVDKIGHQMSQNVQVWPPNCKKKPKISLKDQGESVQVFACQMQIFFIYFELLFWDQNCRFCLENWLEGEILGNYGVMKWLPHLLVRCQKKWNFYSSG